jgi:hypothetical protein
MCRGLAESSSGRPSNRFTRPVVGVSRNVSLQSSQVKSSATVQREPGRHAPPIPKARGKCSSPSSTCVTSPSATLETAAAEESKSEMSGFRYTSPRLKRG